MKKWIIIILSTLFIISCESITYKKPKTCSTEEQNRFVYEYMKSNYLWYKELPSIDYSKYSSPEALLEALKNSKDHWSFIINKQALDDYFSGKGYIGYGFKLTFDSYGDLIITLVYPNSPASRAGLSRGDKILKINGVSVDNIYDINSAFGKDEAGVATTLEIEKSSQIYQVTIYKEKINAPSVLKTKVLDINGLKVGYILFDKFIDPSTNELKSAFDDFKNVGIDSLIIDMRYNSGGLVNVANDLVSLIIGARYKNRVSMSLEFNDKNSYKNSSYYIKEYGSSFDLDEVYFITTKNTCSSSEAVINALYPYGVDVKIVGSKTCGKPVGMVGEEFCSKYLMPIEFKIVNANGYGDYFNGISVNCLANDDIYHDFGEKDENMLKSTAYLIENGVCLDNANARLTTNQLSKARSIELKGVKSITGAF